MLIRILTQAGEPRAMMPPKQSQHLVMVAIMQPHSHAALNASAPFAGLVQALLLCMSSISWLTSHPWSSLASMQAGRIPSHPVAQAGHCLVLILRMQLSQVHVQLLKV